MTPKPIAKIWSSTIVKCEIHDTYFSRQGKAFLRKKGIRRTRETAYAKKAGGHEREQEFRASNDREDRVLKKPGSVQVTFVNLQKLSKSLEQNLLWPNWNVA